MKMQTQFKIDSQEHWHELRAKNIGASEVAALFGYSPYTTKFTLWHQKAGKVAAPDFDSERIKWGSRLETPIALGIAVDQGWKVRKVHRYLAHKTNDGMGCSLDYEIINHPDGPGCFEIKNVSYEIWKKQWLQNEDGTIEAPLHIELQLQHQMAVTGWAWGAIGFLVGGNKAEVVVRKRHQPTIDKIEKAVADFWKSINEGVAPPIEYSSDLAVVASLFNADDTIETESEEFATLCAEYIDAQAGCKSADLAKEEAKLKLVGFLDENAANVAIGNGFKASYKKQKRAAYTVKESEFSVLRVTELKG